MDKMRMIVAGAAAVSSFALPACGNAQVRTVTVESGAVRIETVARGLEHPWGLAFLPDGRMLVTEREGRLRVVSGTGEISPAVAGVPKVYARGQGGLLDVALDPEFAENNLVYLSYAEPRGDGAATAVARGRLAEGRLDDLQVIFRQQPAVDGTAHFGSRLAFSADGMLFVTMGERFKFTPAQELGNHLGTIVRIGRDGSVPRDSPFVNRSGAKPEIWSFGHRNIQGAAIHPETGALWVAEHGPRGGDELNVIEPGRNYGWPLVSWGRHYDGRDIPDPPTRPDLAPSIHQWTPVIAASGLAFYTGDRFPAWRGSALIGGLVAEAVARLSLDGRKVTGEERIPIGSRVRDVRQGPDGAVYVLTDESDGALLRLTPARQGG